MRRKNLNICSMCLVALIGTLSLSGCGSKSIYTEEQEDMIANYAADIVLKHDVEYKYNYIGSITNEVKEETTTRRESIETETIPDGSNMEQPTGQISDESDNDHGISEVSEINAAFGVPNGINVSFLECDVMNKYPNNDEESAFVMKALDNNKLLVAKFSVTNVTNESINVNFMENERKYKGIVNGTKKYNSQLTLVEDALNTYEGTIEPGTSKELVLIYQTQIDSKDEVNNFSVTVSDVNGKINTVYLK